MIAVFSDFQLRAKEVEGYFRLVQRLGDESVALRQSLDNKAAFSRDENEELLRTLKATCYLLLYNLVESTMRNAIEAIFDELQQNGIAFDLCREELRREILKNFKRRDTDRLLPKLMSLARDVVFATFELSETFAGNLDARSIRSTAKRFGFAEPSGNQFWMLQTVKDVRNDLAHGVKSFAEVGRNASPSDLEQARLQTVTILTETLNNISTYLTNRDYLLAPTLTTSP